jgi:hypothetical protein
MGIKSVGLHQNRTQFWVNPGRVGLNPGRVDRVGWGERAGPGTGKTKGGQTRPALSE